MKITKGQFNKYLGVQRSGVTNMFDVKFVQFLTGLTRNRVIYIMENYQDLHDTYVEKHPSKFYVKAEDLPNK